METVSFCDGTHHRWCVTSAPGWFACANIDQIKQVKKGKQQIARYIPCPAVAHCPGCLGYRLAGTALVLCEAHQSCDVEEYPLAVRAASSSVSVVSAEQTSWL